MIPLEETVNTEHQGSDLIDSLIGNSTPGDYIKSVDFGSIADISGVVGGFLSGFYRRFDFAAKSYVIAILPEVVSFIGDIVSPDSKLERQQAIATVMTAAGKDLAVIGLAALSGYMVSRARDFYRFVRG